MTGATGFVARGLVPILDSQGVELLLVSREPRRLSKLFPHLPNCGYEELEKRAFEYDLLMHLAVVNNNSKASEDVFFDVNVGLLLEVASIAQRARISRFVNISTVHALDADNLGHYARSKREGERRLAGIEGISATTLFLPAVYGDRWAGALSFLNRLPRRLSGPLFNLLAALKPVVHISRIASFVLVGAKPAERSHVVLTDGQQANAAYRLVRRAVDLSFALSLVFFFWWMFAIIGLLVRVDSPGPAIFSQKRVGRGGAIFTCYKFRTMRVGTEQVVTNRISVQAVTRAGRFLRRTKLDELPQVWNILRNEMSLVGPRPSLPILTELVEARRQRGVLQLKPGITGLAQVNHIDMSDAAKLAECDARYLALQSLMLDLKIILMTAAGSGRGDRIVSSAQTAR